MKGVEEGFCKGLESSMGTRDDPLAMEEEKKGEICESNFSN